MSKRLSLIAIATLLLGLFQAPLQATEPERFKQGIVNLYLPETGMLLINDRSYKTDEHTVVVGPYNQGWGLRTLTRGMRVRFQREFRPSGRYLRRIEVVQQ